MANIDYKEILTGLEKYNMTVPEFAVFLTLADVRFASKTRLNEAFRGLALRDDVAQQVWSLWQELEEMRTCLLPYSVDLSSGARAHAQLMIFREAVRRGALEVLGLNSSSSDTEPANNITA
jgi:hypothetical protein